MLPPEAQRQLDNERTKLAAMEPPSMLDPETAASVRSAIVDSFIVGFRRALTLAAALAVLGALVAWLVIESRPHGRSLALITFTLAVISIPFFIARAHPSSSRIHNSQAHMLDG